jgi:TonB family protein
MKHLAFLTAAFMLLLCALHSDTRAQSGRREPKTDQKTVPLILPEPPKENRGASDLKEEEETQCVQEEDAGAKSPAGDAQAEEVFTGTQVTTRAVIKSKPHPAYTEEARWQGTSGVVRLRVLLASTGRVTNVKVLKALPDGLTKNAINAACAIKFTPATKDGRAVSQYVVVEYGFQVDQRRLPVYQRRQRWP